MDRSSFSGQERYGNLTRVYYRDAVGGFVVFDISRDLQESLEIVKKWKSDVDSKSTSSRCCHEDALHRRLRQLSCCGVQYVGRTVTRCPWCCWPTRWTSLEKKRSLPRRSGYHLLSERPACSRTADDCVLVGARSCWTSSSGRTASSGGSSRRPRKI